MAKMKTLSINGKQYTVDDPDAVTYDEEQDLEDEQKATARKNIGVVPIDDTAIGADLWSSKNIVDKLCPSFTESGTAVTCEPVEGYPLGVEISSKNLVPQPYSKGTHTGNGVTFTVNDDYSITLDGTATGTPAFLFLGKGTGLNAQKVEDVGVVVGEIYTMSTGTALPNGVSLYVCFYDETGASMPAVNVGAGASSKAFTIPSGTAYIYSFLHIAQGSVLDNLTVYPMIEKGSAATGYTPYNIVPTVTHLGANLIQYPYYEPKRTANGIDITIREDGSVTIKGTATASTSIRLVGNGAGVYASTLPDWIVPGMTYTLSTNADLPSGARIIIYFYDEANINLGYIQAANTTTGTVFEGAVKWWVFININKDVTVDHTIYPMLQLGSVSTGYEPYRSETVEPGIVTAYPGINTLASKDGYITVTGKKDPVALINKLEATVNALLGG